MHHLKNKQIDRAAVQEYASIMRSLLICQAMSDIFSVNEAIRHCAGQCLIRVKRQDIRAILRQFIIAKLPAQVLTKEVRRIEESGLDVVTFLQTELEIA